jgi:hypothetical protein
VSITKRAFNGAELQEVNGKIGQYISVKYACHNAIAVAKPEVRNTS